jgi:hypothetical protein
MTAPQAPAKASLLEDFIEIFTSPAQVFQRRMGSNWIVMFIILGVVAIALLFVSRGVMRPAFDADWQRIVTHTMATNPQVTAAQMEQGRAFYDKFGLIIFAFFILVAMLMGGLVLWAVGKMFGAVQTLNDAMMVAVYAWIPRVLGLLVVLVIAMLMDPAKLNSMYAPTLSASRFFDPDATAQRLMLLGSRVDIFIVWQTILLGIGLSVTGKIPRAKAFMAAAVVWLLAAGVTMMSQR